MSEDTPDPADVEIEPRARQVATLGPSNGPSERENCGILPPFSGLLQRESDGESGGHRRSGSRGRSGRSGPALAYLTLQPLVVEHLRERTERESRVEAVERAAEGASDEERTDDATETTVREFIRGESGADGGGDRDAVVDDVRDDGDASLDPLDVARSSDDQASGQARPGEKSRASENERANTDAGSSLGDGSPFDRSADAGDVRPGTTLDVGGRGRADDGPAMDGRDGGGSVDPSLPGATDAPARPGADQGPDLVVAERPTADDAADAVGQSGEPSLTVQSRDVDGRGASDGDVSGPGVDGAPGAAPPDGDRRSRTAAADSDGAPSAPRDGRRGSVEALPLDLDAVDRPDLDRFVDQLSDELARKERTERERRGL